MKKRIYLNTPIENVDHLRKDENIRRLPDYTPDEYIKSHRYEFGRIETETNNYHILVGNIPQKGCPWCGHEPRVIRNKASHLSYSDKYYLYCDNCCSRGPLINVNPIVLDEAEDWIIEFLYFKYSDRIYLSEHCTICSEKASEEK